MVKSKAIKRKCIVDGRIFEVYPKRNGNHHHHNHGNRTKYKRPRNSLTCCRACSRKYLANRKQYLKKRKAKK